MDGNIGVILVDGDEIILRIYVLNKQKEWDLFRYQSYDLASGIPGKSATSSDIVGIIAGVLLTRYASTITDWKICARNLQEDILHDIAEATGFPSELLTLEREQELLCKGILMDLD